MGAPPAGYPCPPWELSERPVDHAGQVHDHYPARGAPVSYRLKDRAPALHESMAYVAALGGDGASPALLYRGDEPASPPRDPAADDTARGDLELSLVFESDAARMVSELKAAVAAAAASLRDGDGDGDAPAASPRGRAATLNVYEVVIDQDGALGLGLRRRRARAADVAAVNGEPLDGFTLDDVRHVIAGADRRAPEPPAQRGRAAAAGARGGVAGAPHTVNGKHVIAVVHVKPGGQSDAAGIVVGSRLVGVNGDGVSNRPASSDNDPYRLLGVAKDADESAIRKAYKKTSLKTHPDRGGRKSLFVAVNKAYAVLADEQTRRDYDTCADSVDFDKAMTLIKNSPRPLTLQLVRPVEKEPEDEEEDEEEST
ncbi:DnaJ-like protein [Aureococcus anophagefferens]|uniref:DnaJ-like protein n=2 Tax=Aureococcus anophagefferens TaxID=44056 RepID=A0ABR1FLA2_AURAN